MKKKVVFIALSVALVLSLCACDELLAETSGTESSKSTESSQTEVSIKEESSKSETDSSVVSEDDSSVNTESSEKSEAEISDVSSEPESSDESSAESVVVSDLDIITREGHPTYLGSVELSHQIWDDVEKGKILFGDGILDHRNKYILSMNALRNSDIISGVSVNFSYFEPRPSLAVNDVLPIIYGYCPFDNETSNYRFYHSYAIIPDDGYEEKGSCYITSYKNDDETWYVFINVSPDGTVDSFSFGRSLSRWMYSLKINNYHTVDWHFDFLSPECFDRKSGSIIQNGEA